MFTKSILIRCLFVLSLIAILILLNYCRRQETKPVAIKVNSLFQSGEIAIGEIVDKAEMIPGAAPPYSRTLTIIKYRFDVSGSVYDGEIHHADWRASPKKLRGCWRWEKSMKAAKYVVLFDKSHPENSIILLGCPITRSTPIEFYKDNKIRRLSKNDISVSPYGQLAKSRNMKK